VAVYKIRVAKRDSRDPGLVAYFDKRSYRPLLLVNPKLRVVTFEYLPATPSNLKLLDIRTHHPGAPVVK
jgi:hypothetical protein